MSRLVLGEQTAILKLKVTQHSLFNRSTYFRRHNADCFNSEWNPGRAVLCLESYIRMSALIFEETDE
jgi:hypothetical protein